MKLTAAHIRKAVEKLKSNAVAPGRIVSRKQAKIYNDFDREFLGIKSNWKIGDELYQCQIHPASLKRLTTYQQNRPKRIRTKSKAGKTQRTREATKLPKISSQRPHNES